MTTKTLDTNETLSATADVISELTDLMLSVDEDKVNTDQFPNEIWPFVQSLRERPGLTLPSNCECLGRHPDH